MGRTWLADGKSTNRETVSYTYRWNSNRPELRQCHYSFTSKPATVLQEDHGADNALMENSFSSKFSQDVFNPPTSLTGPYIEKGEQ